MKKTLLFFISVCSIAFLIYLIAFSHHSTFSGTFQNDTVSIKKSLGSAKALLQNKPDSSILLYTNTIKRMETLPSDAKVRHLMASAYLDLSTVYIPLSNYDKAKELRIKALNIAGVHDPDIQARVFIQEGLICYHHSQYSEALKLYEQANVLAIKLKDLRLQSKIISNKAIIDYAQGNIKTGIAGFNKTLQMAEKLKDPGLISDAYLNLGSVYTDQMDYQRARQCYTTVIEYFKKNKQFDDLMKCYQNLGNVYYMMEKYPDAIDWYHQSLQLALQLNNKMVIAKDYHNIGEVNMLIGDYVGADQSFIRSLKIKESIGDKASIAKGYRSLGDLYFIQKNYTKSLLYQQKSLQINSTLGLIKNQAKDYANLSTVYAELKQLPVAVNYCKKAIELAQQVEDAYGVAEDTRTLGGFYFLQKKYDQAEVSYLKAISLKKNMFDQEGMASVYCQLAELYTARPATPPDKSKNLQKALFYGLKAFALAEQVKIPRLISDASNDLSEIYKQQKNYPKALSYSEINKKANDSIFNTSKTEALAFAEARWNSEKKQQQIISLKKLNVAISSQKLAEAKQHKTLLIGLIFIFVLIAIAADLYWLYFNKKRENRYQQQLTRMSMLRLQNIRNRISPHFIFNILNREIGLEENKDKHPEMTGLVKFLRRSLEVTEKTSVTLAEELDFVRNYLQMEQPVLGSDFKTHWEIDKRIMTENFRIPAMMIQIPVENALKHALKEKEGEKQLMIALTLMKLGILITIQDNGSGYFPEQASNTKGTGTGLKVLYQTIQLLNLKNEHKIGIDISNLSGETTGGTKVEITVPGEYNFDL